MAEIDLSGKTILIADDEEFARQIVVRVLRELGTPKVLQARDGHEALEMLDQPMVPVDIALLDFNMPRGNGLQLLKRVRTGGTASPRTLPVALLTGNSDRDLVGKAMELDVSAFMVKPVSRKALTARLVRMTSEEPFSGSLDSYRAVDVEDPTQRDAPELAPAVYIPRSVVTGPVGERPATTGAGGVAALPGRRIRRTVDELKPNSQLAEDVISPKGVRLLSAGVTINPRILSRLKDLAELREISHVWVREPF